MKNEMSTIVSGLGEDITIAVKLYTHTPEATSIQLPERGAILKLCTFRKILKVNQYFTRLICSVNFLFVILAFFFRTRYYEMLTIAGPVPRPDMLIVRDPVVRNAFSAVVCHSLTTSAASRIFLSSKIGGHCVN